MAESRFATTFNRGFVVTFTNGYTVSVQWGRGNYGSRRTLKGGLLDDLKTPEVEARTAEVLVIRPDGSDVRHEGDDGAGCLGWQTADMVASILHRFAGPAPEGA